jgi:hypothetical protein
MAKLYQSEWDTIKTRRGVQDLNDLIALIEEDGTLEIAEDPSEDEILKAREQAAKDAEKKQKEAEKEQAAAAKEQEKQSAADAEAAETARVAALPHPDDQGMDDLTENPPEGSEVAQGTDKATEK